MADRLPLKRQRRGLVLDSSVQAEPKSKRSSVKKVKQAARVPKVTKKKKSKKAKIPDSSSEEVDEVRPKEKKDFTCPKCGVVLPTSDWEEHVRYHESEAESGFPKCVICRKKFKTFLKTEKENHMQRHFMQAVKSTQCRGQLTGIKCPLCNFNGKCYDFFKNHIFRKHFGGKTGKDTCEICKTTFPHAFDFICHLFESHITSLPWCSYLECNFGESHPRLLEKHLLVDHGCDPMCPFCGKRAKWMKVHMRGHGMNLQDPVGHEIVDVEEDDNRDTEEE